MWRFLVAEFTDGPTSSNKLWIDGVPQTLSYQLGGPNNGDITTTSAINGWRLDARYRLSGDSAIDDVSIFNGVLTNDEVLALMSGPTPPVPELPTLVLALAGLAGVATLVLASRRAR